MSIVVPAILPKSRAELDAALARLAPFPQITDVQIDIVDGQFAKPMTWPYAGDASWELPLVGRFRYDLDLMVREPGSSIGRWIELGASRITIHAESTSSLRQCVAEVKARHGHEAGFVPDLLSLGLAIGLSTPVSLLEPFLGDIDYVELMGIATIGRQGEPFDARVLPKIRALRALAPALPIQIDGGVSLTSAPELLAAGASRLVVGSALLKAADIGAELAKFEALGDTYGVYER